MKAKEKVLILKPHYPGINKFIFSMAMNEQRYGITLCNNAKRLLEAAGEKKAEKRLLSSRIMFRLTSEEKTRFELAIHDMGYATTQDYMHEVVTKAIAACPAPTRQAAKK